MSRRRSRTSFSHALRNIVRATEDLVDDALDRAGDFECGLRRSVSRALDDDDYDDHRDRRGHDYYDCDYDYDDWGGPRDRQHRRGRRPGDGPRRRLGPDEGEPYASVPPPGSRLRSDDDHPDGDPDELTALKDQLELLRGRMGRRLGEGDHPGGRGRVPRVRGAEDAEALKDELARLADRIDRFRDAR
ncbi:hypothetical protein ACH49O_19990 [Streptomyces coeruleorubidus]|uniref:hypothetical protein n=1 Tax=Streptomyces coeruleorubidus TaxID=116188 RepID=UPI0033EE221C